MKFLHVKERKFKGNKLSLIGLGDVHYGSKDVDLQKFKDTINWVKDKDTARVILMGDLLDIGLKDSIGGGTFDNTHEPEEQITDIIDLLYPIRKKIWCMLGGNHEERIRLRTSIDINKLIAKALNVTYCGSTVFIKALIGNQVNYTIFAAHGNTGALTPAGKLNSIMKYATYIDADIFMMGHVHELMHHTCDYFHVSLRNKQIVKSKRHFVITGHFLSYGGYAEQKGYAPGKTGVPKIILRKDKKKANVSI